MIRCTQCNTINLDFQLSCTQCGTKLWSTCGSCNAMVPLGARFCGNCGSVRPENVPQAMQRVQLSHPNMQTEPWFLGRKLLLEKIPPLLTDVLNGEGQVVFFTGEAGIGKSSVIRQVLKYGRDNQMRVFHIRPTVSYRHLLFYPLIDLVRQVSDIRPSDDRNVILQKITQLAGYGLTNEEVALVGKFFGLDLQGAANPSWSTEAQYSAAFYTFVKLMRNISLKTPLIIALDDTYFLDGISIHFMQPLIEVVNGMRVMLLVGSRENEPAISTHAYVHILKMDALEARDILRLAEAEFDVATLPRDLAQELYIISDGNPMMMKMLARFMRESGVVEERDGERRIMENKTAIQKPTTLEGVIRARMDGLPAELRELLILITLADREATFEVLRTFSRTKEKLEEHIRELGARGWISLTGDPATGCCIASYTVHYVLDYLIAPEIRTGIQPSLAKYLLERGSHDKWMREFFVAYHMSAMPLQAFEAHYALERMARQMNEYQQAGLALITLQRVSQILKQFIQNEKTGEAERRVMEQKLAYILQSLGDAYTKQMNNEKALKTFDLGLQLARSVNFHYLALDLVAKQIGMLKQVKRFHEAHKLVDVAIQIAQGIKFSAGVSRFYYLKGQLYEAEGRFDLALGMYLDALRISEEIENDINKEDAYADRAALGAANIILRQKEGLEKVSGLLLKSIDYCMRYKHMETMQEAMEVFGRYFQETDNLANAIKYTDVSLKIARARLDYREMSRLSYLLGYYHVLKKDTERAEMYFSEGLSLALQSNWPYGVELSRKAMLKLQSDGGPWNTGTWKAPRQASLD